MPPTERRRDPRGGKPSGTPADRLVRAWLDGRDADFDDLAEELVSGGRDGVVDAAVRKVAERFDDEALLDFALGLVEVAEAAEAGPSGWAEIVAVPAGFLDGTAAPDPAPLAAGLPGSGAFPEGTEARFLPEWRSVPQLLALPPTAVRRVLVDLAEGRAPADLPPADPAELASGGVFALIGLVVDWRGEPAEGDAEADPDASGAAFDARHSSVMAAGLGVPSMLPPMPPSVLGEELEARLGEGGAVDGAHLDELRGFVDMARREAPGEEVVCRLRRIDSRFELVLATRAGRVLDSLQMTQNELPAPPDAFPGVVEAIVPLVRDLPGAPPPAAHAIPPSERRRSRPGAGKPSLRLVSGRRG